jgi:lipoprotein-anchoring transpeptidase ErfK/SrfK
MFRCGTAMQQSEMVFCDFPRYDDDVGRSMVMGCLRSVCADSTWDSPSIGAGRLRTVLASCVAVAALTVALEPAQASFFRNSEPSFFGFQGQQQQQYYYGNPAPTYRRPPVAPAKHHEAKDAKKSPSTKPLEQPLIEISIAKQQLTLYEKGEPVAHAPVSTGMAGHRTPTGIFSVIQKEVFHRSNIYSNAPMPFMQRITWSGVALHAGVLPGYPASHGCIRMPSDFAVKLYHLTRRGARVLVLPGEVAPVRFENPRLFTAIKPAEHANEVVTAADTPAIKTLQVNRAAASQASPVLSDASRETVGVGQSSRSLDAQAPDRASPNATEQDSTAVTTGTVVVKPIPVAAPQPIELRRSFQPAGDISSVSSASSFQSAPTLDAAPATETPPAGLVPYGPERPLRAGPITVFISKKEGKLFVRKGFEPVFSSPVTFANPDEPIGTHLFTAIEANPDETSFRWDVVSLSDHVGHKPEASREAAVRGHKGRHVEQVERAPRAATAAQALDRVEIPQEARERISALMSTGAALIISDQGLGGETGRETDFIVLTR